MDIEAESEIKFTYGSGVRGIDRGVINQSHYDGEALRVLLSGHGAALQPTSASHQKEAARVGLEREAHGL